MSYKSDWIRLLVKYKGKCSECGKEIQKGEYALWSKNSKNIKHESCKVQAAAHRNGGQPSEGIELDCFICDKSAGCLECGFEADCNRAVVSQACICNLCFSAKGAYVTYQDAFLAKMRKIAIVKI
jgi:hypothetical protein